ncbi:hypothetical protein GALMADRAFT_446394 [Galerina marginata CBS 339.88]|uniref:Uncharacterized protein n=1 Tax=Galerina marginata (strain CBS 339.88) TaxID=685588 RepID=A0A067SZX0_GALM3|nr:hypothetical protein GALMADRAFT_446394 [Galerina marginata CBS 339.88]
MVSLHTDTVIVHIFRTHASVLAGAVSVHYHYNHCSPSAPSFNMPRLLACANVVDAHCREPPVLVNLLPHIPCPCVRHITRRCLLMSDISKIHLTPSPCSWSMRTTPPTKITRTKRRGNEEERGKSNARR